MTTQTTGDMAVNLPEVLSDLRGCFDAYETALLENDLAALAAMFMDGEETIRYGVADHQYCSKALAEFRATQAPFSRNLIETRITTYGRDFGIASTLFRRDDSPDQLGRQMQTWLRTADGWRIVAALVSSIPG